MEIKATIFRGEEGARTCSVTGKAFNQNAGLQYTLNDTPVSPEVAHRAGFEMSEALTPPSDVVTKAALSGWLSDLGLRSGSKHYRELYSKYSPLYKMK